MRVAPGLALRDFSRTPGNGIRNVGLLPSFQGQKYIQGFKPELQPSVVCGEPPLKAVGAFLLRQKHKQNPNGTGGRLDRQPGHVGGQVSILILPGLRSSVTACPRRRQTSSCSLTVSILSPKERAQVKQGKYRETTPTRLFLVPIFLLFLLFLPLSPFVPGMSQWEKEKQVTHHL